MIPVAKVTRRFGAEQGGDVLLSLYADFPEEFPAGEPLFARIDGLYVPLYCARFERRGAAGAVAAFDDLDTARRADELVGRELYREEAEETAADDDTFYMEDLIGFAARAGMLRGEVTEYYDSEANPLLGVTFDGREYLVPAVEAIVRRIDFAGRTLELELPEGLLEMQR